MDAGHCMHMWSGEVGVILKPVFGGVRYVTLSNEQTKRFSIL